MTELNDDSADPAADSVESGLSPRQARFVDEYLIDLNATKAAIRAGYGTKNADVNGPRLLGHAGVARAIAERKAARSERTEVTADRVLQEIAAIAFADIGDVMRVDDDGKVFVRELDSLKPEARRSIAEITQHTTEHVEAVDGESVRTVEKIRLAVKFHPKVAALKLLVDHLGIAAPIKHQHDITTPTVVVLPDDGST